MAAAHHDDTWGKFLHGLGINEELPASLSPLHLPAVSRPVKVLWSFR